MSGDSPLARAKDGAPLAYATLGLAFHLEALAPEDGDGLAAACERIAATHAGTLTWAWSSVHGEVARFDASVLDLVSTFPAQLANAPPTGDARADAGASAMTAAHYDRFGVACHGGRARNDASPSSLRFFARVSAADGPLLRADAMLSATFPSSTPPAEIEELALAVAGDLRFRWGAAGFAYSAWELDRYGPARDALHAHARRHPGYDLGQHATWMRAFHDRLRTVSWLTFVGPALAAKLPPAALESDPDVAVTKLNDGVVFRAGETPKAGDVNRDDFPHAYCEVDRRLRSIRAAEGIHFYAPWTSSSTEAWLRRFER
ncbi:MAG: DUF3396 domain-containing protein [Labilithrix sp.]|nr:DUF3396 domain-containing protein [Labilithrix sp.]MCW5811474.1 DUF3396 domain-containing protein [Labilithrix sp.]